MFPAQAEVEAFRTVVLSENKVSVTLTVFFEDPFWVGIFERESNGKLYAAKYTFGAEPKSYEVYQLILKHYYDLTFSPAVENVRRQRAENAKRAIREARKSVQNVGIGTKAQQALKFQQEQTKQTKKITSHERRVQRAEALFLLKQQKKKEKHKGR